MILYYDVCFVSGFILFGLFVVVSASLLIFYVVPRHGNSNVLVYVTICSVLGSFTVMGCKGLGVALKQTFGGHSELTNWLTWVLLLVVVSCILIQLNYLNKALDIFNTSVVTPIYYVFFTSSVMVASLILFKEWYTMKTLDIVGNLCGFLTIIAGIFLLNAFKDINLSLANLPKARKDDQSSSSSLNGSLLPRQLDDTQTLLGTDLHRREEDLESEYHDSPDNYPQSTRPGHG